MFQNIIAVVVFAVNAGREREKRKKKNILKEGGVINS
jgi:hypothetical protein